MNEITFQVGHGEITLVQGDITRQSVDAVVNAANSRLAGGGGVDGAIHAAAGPELMKACRAIGGCPTGSAVLTPGFGLRAGFVIHAVGPVWHGGGQGEPELLRSAYRTSLEIGAQRGIASIAFPSLSTGAFGYPIDPAARIALSEAKAHLEGATTIRLVRFVLFDAGTFERFKRAGEGILGGI